MKTLRVALLCAVLNAVAPAWSADSPLRDVKLGFGFDRGLGITGSFRQFNGFVGNDGSALDFVFARGRFAIDETVYWYVGGGGFVDWDGDWGARLPVGADMPLNDRIDIFAQIIPGFRANHDAKFILDVGVGIRYRF